MADGSPIASVSLGQVGGHSAKQSRPTKNKRTPEIDVEVDFGASDKRDKKHSELWQTVRTADLFGGLLEIERVSWRQ